MHLKVKSFYKFSKAIFPFGIAAELLNKGPFKYYVIKEVGGWGQKMAIFDDLQYCKSSKRWVGLKKSKP